MTSLDSDRLAAGMDHIRSSPSDTGAVEMIVRRPAVDEREVVQAGELDTEAGLVGDNWRTRGSGSTVDGSADPVRQITVMNSRCIALVAGEVGRWPLAGDQLYVDYDLSVDNLPPGTRLAVGSAIIEVSEAPHTGCSKFSGRFGMDALRFVNSPEGRRLRLRGMNARVVRSGSVRRGDAVEKI